jgi:hypothetical protein
MSFFVFPGSRIKVPGERMVVNGCGVGPGIHVKYIGIPYKHSGKEG